MRAAAVLAACLVLGIAWAAPAQGPGDAREIVTLLGRLAVGAVDVGDQFPPGCGVPPGPDCEKASDGTQFVIVWLEPKEDNDLATRARNADVLFVTAHVAVVDAAGTRTERFSLGMREGKLFVAFTTAAGSHGFKLSWPGNADVPLSR